MNILLAGYAGHCPERLLEITKQIDAVVFDIRLRPYSSDERWCGAALSVLLGERYVGLPQWGNPAKLDCQQAEDIGFPTIDWSGGLRRFKLYCGERKPVVAILLCGCRSITECHRAAVGKRLAVEERYEVRELHHWNTPEKTRALPLERELAEMER